MRNKVSKEIRMFIKLKYPGMFKTDDEKKVWRKLYQSIKKKYKTLPWNQKLDYRNS